MSEPKLESISLYPFNYGSQRRMFEIRLDWSNNRHQAVALQNTNANEIIDGLRELIRELKNDKANGNI